MMGWSLFPGRAAVRAAGKRLQADLLEMRLYSSEPALMWAAQKALVRDNVRWLALLLPPALILGLPLAWLFIQLDGIYGRNALPVGGVAVVTVQLKRALEPADAAATLQAPPGIAVESPPVRIIARRQISWRIRALRPVRGNLRFVMLPAGDVAWVKVNYP
jgi:hypothetical protein